MERYKVALPDVEWFQKNIKCQDACPAHTDVSRYVSLIAQGKFEEAYAVNRKVNVFPSILGRVCAHYCETACRRGDHDSPVAICSLKRAAADFGRSPDHRSPISPKAKRVAIVGGGPTGLTVAYDLALTGYQVTIYEALPVIGGMLNVGIPPWRLPKRVTQSYLDELRDLGVAIKLNMPVGKVIGLDDIVRNYDAVLIAAGAHKPDKLGIPGEDIEGVIHGVTFMRQINLGEPTAMGQKVAVIGGGFTAMDCARSSIRLGAKEVVVVYRRSREEMPASVEEVEETEKEGVRFLYLATPLRILAIDGNRVGGLECLRNELGEPDPSGRRRPVPIKGSEFVLDVDTVIPAVSQSPDTSFLPPEAALELSRWDRLAVDPQTFMTNRLGIFAAGDFITGPRDVIKVIADGHKVAASISRYLEGTRPPRVKAKLKVLPSYARYDSYEKTGRARMPVLPLSKRQGMEPEVDLGFTRESAMLEALRCYQCNLNIMIDGEKCILCGGCVDVCPQRCIKMIPIEAIQGEEEVTELISSRPWNEGRAMILDDDLCIRCGLCLNRCPTKAIAMTRFEMEEEEPIPAKAAAMAASVAAI